jgi:hypothetical protein
VNRAGYSGDTFQSPRHDSLVTLTLVVDTSEGALMVSRGVEVVTEVRLQEDGDATQGRVSFLSHCGEGLE